LGLLLDFTESTFLKNLIYKTSAIKEYFSSHRIKWEDFYPSEKSVIDAIFINNKSTILDIGCGCAGLGLALKAIWS